MPAEPARETNTLSRADHPSDDVRHRKLVIARGTSVEREAFADPQSNDGATASW